MKITLDNFGIYSKKTITLNENFILFQGLNGSGKSTVFLGMSYVLYGKEKDKRIRYGETACKVSLEIDDYMITRSSKPKKLVVVTNNQKYEGEKAQNVINSYMGGDWEHYSICTSISSKTRSSIATITPAQRYKIISQLASNSLECANDRTVLLERKKTTQNDILKLQSNLESLQDSYKRFSSIEKPKGKRIAKNLDKEIESLSDERKRIENIRPRNEIETRLDELEKLPLYKNKMEFFREMKEYVQRVESDKNDRKRFEKDCKTYFESIQDDLNDINTYFENVDEENIQNVSNEYAFRQIQKGRDNPYWNENPSKIKQLLKQTSKCKVTSEMKNTKQECPHCKKNLCIDESKILKYLKKYEKAKPFVSEDNQDFLNDMKEILFDYDENIIEKYDNLLTQKSRKKECENILKKRILTPELNRINKHIDREIPKPEKYLKKYTLKYIEKRMSEIQDRIDSIDKEKRGEIASLEKLLEDDEDWDEEELVEQLSLIDAKLKKYQKSRIHQEAWKKYDEFNEQVEKISENIDIVTRTLKNAVNELECVNILINTQKEAEIYSMRNVIETINSYAVKYLETFFREPISVSIGMIKETSKSTKPSLEMNASFRGHNVSIEDFSQGESKKVNLAFILALNEMSNSPYLLLDEFMENIDDDLIMEIYEVLEKWSETRPIYVIDFRSVSGIFDRIIEFV